MIRIARVAVALAALSASGCAPKFAVRYSLRKVHAVKDPKLAQLSLRIGPIRDERWSDPQAKTYFGGQREIKSDGARLCVNGEQGYRSPAVTEQVADAIAAHLRKMETYAAVTTDATPTSYLLRGTLSHFFGMQPAMSYLEVAISQAATGAVGAGTSKGGVDIELTDLELLGPDGQRVARLDDIHEHYEGLLPVDMACNLIYSIVNDMLPIIADRLATQLAAKLREIVAPTQVGQTTSVRD